MYRRKTLAALACAATLTIGGVASAQLTLTGQTYDQNFDGIGTGLPTGWTVRTGASSVALGSTAGFTGATSTWADTAGAFKNLAGATGFTGTESTATQNAATNRALAVRQSAAFGDPGAAFTLQIGNTAGRTNFALSFTAEMLSVQTRNTTWLLQYALGPVPSSFTDLGSFADPGAFGTTTINASAAISGIENQSQNVWLRVVAQDASTGTGNRDTFGIDDFHLTWTGEGTVVNPHNLTWNGSTGNWETTNNWLDGATPATFSSSIPDNAIFSNGALPATVTLGSPIVAGSITFAATAPVHTLTGSSLATIGNITADQSVVLDTPVTIAGAQSWTIAAGKNIAVNQPMAGGSLLTKAGAGSLVLNSPASNGSFTGGVTINAGTVSVTASDPTSITVGTLTGARNTTGLGQGPTNINSGGVLEIVNVPVGNGLFATGPQIFLNNGGTLIGTGSLASYGRSGGALTVQNGTSGSPNVVDLKTGSADTVFTFGSSHRQATAQSGDTFTTVRVSGPGRVVFQSGGTTSTTGFAGSWEVDGGILQLGPVADSTSFGEPLNALGQKGAFSLQDAVTLKPGGILAGATNTANPQTSGSDFFNGVGGVANYPGSFRSTIILAGGSLATTVDSGVAGGSLNEAVGANGATDGARYSGDLTVKAGPASTILVDDPVGAPNTPRVVVLTTTPPVPGNITWEAGSTLNVTGHGTLEVARNPSNGGTVSVGAGAQLVINPNATVNLSGATDVFYDGTTAVNVVNNSTSSFNVNNGFKHVGNLTGSGNTHVATGVNLSAQVVRQNALTIGNGGVVAIVASGTPNAPAHTSVLKTLSIDGGPGAPTGSLDLTNNSMILDYDGAPAGQVQDVRSLIRNGVNTARGIISSSSTATTRLGYGDNAVLNKSIFGGQSVDTSSILIKYTYAGDADLDGDADGVDIGTWATNFTGELGGTGSNVWTQGDWDYDGDVDGVDAGLWAQAFTGELGGGGLGSLVIDDPNMAPGAAAILRGMGITVVPEPASLGLAALGATMLLRRRRSR